MDIVIKHGEHYNSYEQDIFNSCCDLLVLPVNCEGSAESELTVRFKKRYPEMFKYYEDLCRTRALKAGCPVIYHKQISSIIFLQGIVLFPVKYNSVEIVRLKYIESGLKRLIDIISETDLSLGDTKVGTSIAFPKIRDSCFGNKLDWDDLKEIIISILTNSDKADVLGTIEIYE